MPVINVQMLSGRKAEQKNRFIQEVTDVAMRTLGVPAHAVVILLAEVDPENWGVGARTIAEIRGGLIPKESST